jgi:pimeloyl-ACP methyl ester carboxylesterase
VGVVTVVEASTSRHPTFRSPEARDRYLAFNESRASKWWPVESQNRTVHTGWGETFVRVSGPATAPPLVILPGSRATSLMYSEMIEALSSEHRTYAVDAVYDVGRSVGARRMNKGAQAMEWLDELLDALELDSGVDLMGQSLGATMAADYALHAPKRVRKAVWLAFAGMIVRSNPAFILDMMICQIPSRTTVRHGLAGLLPVAARSGGRARELFDDFVEEVAMYHACYRPFMPPSDSSTASWDDSRLRQFEMPVLFVAGEEERAYSVPNAIERLNAVAPRIETCMIPNAAHDVCFTRPDLASQRILEFLAR